MHKDLHGSLGLAKRAGLLTSGQDAVRKLLSEGKVRLLLLAGDASERTRQEFSLLAADRGVPCHQLGCMQDFGHALGSPPRAVVAITDAGIARRVDQLAQASADR